MTAGSYLSTIRSIEGLYEAVVTDPEAWGEQAFADWAGDTLAEAGDLPKEAQREIRRSLRAAQKLQLFWATQQSTVADHDDWQSRVDIALGAKAWRPLLDLAQTGLSVAPDEELFEQVKAYFSLVNADRWMEGISFEEWAADN
ncbi:MAG: hypothetical protein QNJ81_07425 [Acidimicrobiia bacterium]|nr:hypothetical protein [Acidimicrobiia bacterium]